MKHRTIITLTTDFGDDFAISQLKAVILSINPNAEIVVISNQITNYSIVEGAFVLSQTYKLFPKDTIHIGVVDPGVGSSRDGIVIKTDSYTFIGPNNGLFSYCESSQRKNTYKIMGEKVNKNHSNTFHGRDIFSPLAALLSKGVDLSKYAGKLAQKKLVKFSYIKGQILHMDHYGNIKINFPCDNLSFGDRLKITCNSSQLTVTFCKTFADVSVNELLAYKGSHNTLELAQNLGSAKERLKCNVGETLDIEIIKPKLSDLNLAEFKLKYA